MRLLTSNSITPLVSSYTDPQDICSSLFSFTAAFTAVMVSPAALTRIEVRRAS